MSRVVRQCLVPGVAAALLLSTPLSASGADEILLTLPVSGVHRGTEGASVEVASANVPAELVGQSCEIFGSTVNQRSVHPGNDLLIVNGDESFTIPNFEDAGDIVHDAGDVATLASTIQVFVVFGPDGVSSGGFRVTLRNCSEVTTQTTEPTETTVPPVESTVEETTTTPAPETSVSVDEPDDEGPLVSPEPTSPAGPSTAPTSAAPTTVAPTTTATSEPEPLGPAATDSLPVTGAESSLIASLGAVVLAAGVAMRWLATRASAPK